MFAVYEAAWPRRMRLYPEVPALLEELRGRYRLGIVSNGLGWEQRQKIGPVGLDRYIEAVAISEELGVRKPEPGIFEHVLTALGIRPGEAIHVGDDVGADVAGAHAAGLAAGIWVNRDGGTLAERQPRGRGPAPFAVSDLATLPALIEELSTS
jgi:HAD superfamily hydrolase (TIGR01662 family)